MRTLAVLALVALPALAHAQKEAAVKSAATHADANWPTALKIWEWAEPGYQEKKSAAALAEIAEKAGFTVKKDVAGIPTAFTAEFGSRQAGHRHPGRVRRAAGTVAGSRAVPQAARRRQRLRPRLRASSLRRRVALRGHRDRRADQGGQAEGHGPLLHVPGGGRRRREGVHDARRAVRRLRHGAALASRQPQHGRRRDVPGAHRGEVPLPRHAGARRRLAREGP